jgi:hypothetical protein
VEQAIIPVKYLKYLSRKIHVPKQMHQLANVIITLKKNGPKSEKAFAIFLSLFLFDFYSVGFSPIKDLKSDIHHYFVVLLFPVGRNANCSHFK